MVASVESIDAFRIVLRGAGMSGLKRVANRRSDALAQTHWAEVERLLADFYRNAGYQVDHCGTGANGRKFDGGVDLRLRRAEEYVVVQCKHWNAMKVAHNDVHQLLGIMVNEGATGAILVTSGEFTRAAIEAATKLGHVHLVDGDDLRTMLGPLPDSGSEPDSRWAAFASSGWGRGAARVGRFAGERLLDAAEDRIRGRRGGRRGGSTTVGLAFKLALIKGAIGLFALLFALLLAVILFNQAIGSLHKMAQPKTSQSAPHAERARVSVEQVHPDPVVVAAPPPLPVYQAPTEAEIREQQRKADEAMKIIEATTPEM